MIRSCQTSSGTRHAWLAVGLLLALGLPAAAVAQASPDCSTRPAKLRQMSGCYRPLLVFAPRADDPRLLAQREELDQAADDMMDRFVLLVPIVADPRLFSPPLDAGYALLSPEDAAAARKRFAVGPGSFKVILLGEDGGAKLRSAKPVSVDRLDGLIDSMPTRKVERERPHAN